LTAPIDRALVEILPVFNNFEKELKSGVNTSIQGAGKDLEHVHEQVSGSIKSMGRDLEASNMAVESSVKRVGEHTEGMFSSMKESAKSMFLMMAPMAVGFGAIQFLKGSVEAAADAHRIMREVAQGIASTGEAAHVSAKDVSEYADALSTSTGVTKDVIVGNESILLTFTDVRNEVGKGNDIFTQANKAVLDLSVRMNEDGKAASIQLGKALQDPIKGVTALARVGVNFTEQQKEQIRTMVESGNKLGAQKLILAELNKEFGGSAVAAGSAGSKMKAAYHEVEVAVGEKLLPVMNKFSTFVTTTVLPAFIKFFESAGSGEGTIGKILQVIGKLSGIVMQLVSGALAALRAAWTALNPLVSEFSRVLTETVLPAVSKFATILGKDLSGALTSVGGFIKEHKTLVQSIVVGFLAAYAAIKLYNVGLAAWAAIQKVGIAIQTAWNVVMDANPIGIIIIAVVALTAAFIYAYKHSKTFRDIVDEVGRVAARVGKDVYQFFINLYHVGVEVWHALEDAWKNITGWWGNLITFLKNAWNNVWTFIKTWGPIALIALAPFIGIPLLIAKHFDQIKGFLERAWNAAYDATVGAIIRMLKHIATIEGRILATFINAPRWLIKSGENIIDGFLNGLKGVWHNVTDWFGKWIERIGAAIGNINRWAMDKAVSFLQSYHDGIVNTWHIVTAWFNGMLSSIGNAIGDAKRWAGNVGNSIINGFLDGLKAIWHTVTDWFGNIPGWIKSALGIHSAPQWAVDFGGWIIKGLIQGLIGGAFDFQHFLEHFVTLAKNKLASMFVGTTAKGRFLGTQQLLDWIHIAEGLTGVGDSWTNGLLTLIGRESGGDPRSINTYDINAQHGDPSRGLMQTIGATFEAYRLQSLPDDIYNPVANIVAGIRYILSRYGSISNVQQANPNMPPMGYASGAWNIPQDQLAFLHRREMVIPPAFAEAIRSSGGRAPEAEPIDLSDDTIEKLGRAIGRQINGVGARMLRTARAA